MNESDFVRLAETTLEKLADVIEDHDEAGVFDVEYLDGILTVSVVEKNAQYVINKHGASQKIWYSSPISSTSYFSYHHDPGSSDDASDNSGSNERRWLDDSGRALQDIFFGELKTNFGFAL